MRLYLLYSSRLFAEAILRCLSAQEALSIRGCAQHLHEATNSPQFKAADIVLIDAAWSEDSGVEDAARVTSSISERFPCIKVMFLEVRGPDEAVKLLEAGASGYVLKGASLSEVSRTIEAVHRGTPPCSSEVATLVCARIKQLSERCIRFGHQPERPLTSREEEVLLLVAEGDSNKEIASHLSISVATVKNHVHRILTKLQSSGRLEAAKRAYVSGVIEHTFPLLGSASKNQERSGTTRAVDANTLRPGVENSGGA